MFRLLLCVCIILVIVYIGCFSALPVVKRTELMENLMVVRGSVVTMVCEAHGDPPPTLTWTKDNKPLLLHQNLHQNHLDLLLLDEGKTHLQLVDVQLEGAGVYSCTAQNQAGSSTKTFNLTVLGTINNLKSVCFSELPGL